MIVLAFSGSRNTPGAAYLVGSAWMASPWRAVWMASRKPLDLKVIQGESGDIDHAARRYFEGMPGVIVEGYPANWDAHGKAAGPIRNRGMARVCDGCIAIWDGTSRGTLNMISECMRAGKPVFVFPTHTPDSAGESRAEK